MTQKSRSAEAAIAAAYGQSPPAGQTWVRGASVTGVETERVYRSRSVAKLLFDAIPSKGQAVAGLTWFNFERYCGGWLRRNGFDEVSRKAVDRGVDITAFKDLGAQAEEWAIQCKHWSGKVGPDVVRELEGARTLQGADHAMLMTSSAFTPAAIQTAIDLGIELVDGDQLHDRA
jgi:HJR/Mrr/RecB family endonuclease